LQEFLEWCERLHTYLQTLENRLFSEGLHILGAPPSNSQMAQYLGAYYGDSLPQEAVDVLAEGRGVDAARAALEAAWQQVGGARCKGLFDFTCTCMAC
jgi:magnesium chelatase subunit H